MEEKEFIETERNSKQFSLAMNNLSQSFKPQLFTLTIKWVPDQVSHSPYVYWGGNSFGPMTEGQLMQLMGVIASIAAGLNIKVEMETVLSKVKMSYV